MPDRERKSSGFKHTERKSGGFRGRVVGLSRERKSSGFKQSKEEWWV